MLKQRFLISLTKWRLPSSNSLSYQWQKLLETQLQASSFRPAVQSPMLLETTAHQRFQLGWQSQIEILHPNSSTCKPITLIISGTTLWRWLVQWRTILCRLTQSTSSSMWQNTRMALLMESLLRLEQLLSFSLSLLLSLILYLVIHGSIVSEF